MARVGVLIIDREPSFRAQVKDVLHKWPGFEVVGEKDSSDGAIELIQHSGAEVLLLDLTLPKAADLELARPESHGSNLKWMVATLESLDEGNLLLAIGAGAHACITRASAPGFIRGILHQVVNGEYPIQNEVLRKPNVVRQVLKQLNFYYHNSHEGEQPSQPCPITQREVGVLQLVAVGMANKQIATELDITERTVKNHLYSILRKLGTRDRTHAVYRAVMQRWIQPQDSAFHLDLPSPPHPSL